MIVRKRHVDGTAWKALPVEESTDYVIEDAKNHAMLPDQIEYVL